MTFVIQYDIVCYIKNFELNLNKIVNLFDLFDWQKNSCRPQVVSYRTVRFKLDYSERIKP